MTPTTEELAAELDELAPHMALGPNQSATLRAAAARLRELSEALKPFGAFHGVLITMGGTTPRTGEYCTVVSRSGEASIMVEDLALAAQLTETHSEP